MPATKPTNADGGRGRSRSVGSGRRRRRRGRESWTEPRGAALDSARVERRKRGRRLRLSQFEVGRRGRDRRGFEGYAADEDGYAHSSSDESVLSLTVTATEGGGHSFSEGMFSCVLRSKRQRISQGQRKDTRNRFGDGDGSLIASPIHSDIDLSLVRHVTATQLEDYPFPFGDPERAESLLCGPSLFPGPDKRTMQKGQVMNTQSLTSNGGEILISSPIHPDIHLSTVRHVTSAQLEDSPLPSEDLEMADPLMQRHYFQASDDGCADVVIGGGQTMQLVPGKSTWGKTEMASVSNIRGSQGACLRSVVVPDQTITLDEAISLSAHARLLVEADHPHMVVHVNATYDKLARRWDSHWGMTPCRAGCPLDRTKGDVRFLQDIVERVMPSADARLRSECRVYPVASEDGAGVHAFSRGAVLTDEKRHANVSHYLVEIRCDNSNMDIWGHIGYGAESLSQVMPSLAVG